MRHFDSPKCNGSSKVKDATISPTENTGKTKNQVMFDLFFLWKRDVCVMESLIVGVTTLLNIPLRRETNSFGYQCQSFQVIALAYDVTSKHL